jgi:hypothetical protein
MDINIAAGACQPELSAFAVNPCLRNEDELSIGTDENSGGQSLKAFARCINCGNGLAGGDAQEDATFLADARYIEIPIAEP